MAEPVDTPRTRETALIAEALGMPVAATERLALGGHPWNADRIVAVLAAVLTHGQLGALRIAIDRAPRREWKRRIDTQGRPCPPDADHTRMECLERPGEWCLGIGGHPGRCDLCPTRNDDFARLPSILSRAEALRAEWDRAMWRSAPAALAEDLDG